MYDPSGIRDSKDPWNPERIWGWPPGYGGAVCLQGAAKDLGFPDFRGSQAGSFCMEYPALEICGVPEQSTPVFQEAAEKKGIFDRKQELNFGIMLANVMVAAEQIWVDIDFIRLENITHMSMPDNQYVLSVLPKQA